MSKYQTILLGNGPGMYHALKSLLNSGVNVLQILIQDDIEKLGSDIKKKFIELAGEIPISEQIDSSVKLSSKLDDFPEVDILVAFFFTKIVSSSILERVRIINHHPSLLPHYRGAHPLSWAIINGEKETGLTYHFMDSGVDSGPIIKAFEFELKHDDTYGHLLTKIFDIAEANTGEVFKSVADKTAVAIKQDESFATYVIKRCPEDGIIDWTKTSSEIERLVRALCVPLPGAFSYYKGQKVIISRVEIAEEFSRYLGRITGQVAILKSKRAVLTGDSALVLKDAYVEKTGESIINNLKVNDRFCGK